MALKRKIYQKLLDWKTASNGSSALLIRGARRVGKTFLCKQFGESEYKSMAFIDFSNVSNVSKEITEYKCRLLN